MGAGHGKRLGPVNQSKEYKYYKIIKKGVTDSLFFMRIVSSYAATASSGSATEERMR